LNTFLNAQLRALDVRRARVDAAVEHAAHIEVVRLFDDHAARLRAFVGACGVPASHVDDVVQETFLALFGHLCRGGNADNLRGWLFRVGYRLALKQRTRRRWRERWLMPWHKSAETAIAAQRDPEQRLLQREERRSLFAVIAALSARDRQCVHLRAAGLRYREIAEVLDMSLGAVAKSLARSTAKLTAVRLRSHS
jgi:RNA polymerase sigma-70 factor, ECF subfamily